MRNEYALKGVGYFKHWSDAYGRLGDARRAGKDLISGTSKELHILKRLPLPPGHEIGARWEIVGLVSESKVRLQQFARVAEN